MSMRLGPFLLVLATILSTARGQDDWSQRKRDLREVFQKAHEGTLDEPPPERVAPAGPRIDGRPPGAPAGPTPEELVAALKNAVVALFRAYEQEDVGAFTALLHPSFASADRSGNAYTAASLVRALSDDFAILSNVSFVVQVGQATLQSDGGGAQVEVRWSRRAWVETGGQEWILLDQRSVFRFALAPDGVLKIVAIFGDAIFGLATPQGQVIVRAGTIAGSTVVQPIVLARGEEPKPLNPTPPAPTFHAPIAGSFRFSQAKIDFDTRALDPQCAPPTGPEDLDFDCSGMGILGPLNGAQILDLSSQFTSLDQIAELPAPPYSTSPILITGSPSDIGMIFAVYTTDQKFAVFRISDFSFPGRWSPGSTLDCSDETGCPSFSCAFGDFTIEFLYQADGTRRFKP